MEEWPLTLPKRQLQRTAARQLKVLRVYSNAECPQPQSCYRLSLWQRQGSFRVNICIRSRPYLGIGCSPGHHYRLSTYCRYRCRGAWSSPLEDGGGHSGPPGQSVSGSDAPRLEHIDHVVHPGRFLPLLHAESSKPHTHKTPMSGWVGRTSPCVIIHPPASLRASHPKEERWWWC